jgi:hypothetical protein
MFCLVVNAAGVADDDLNHKWASIQRECAAANPNR